MKAVRNIHWRKTSDHEEGFTLVELLVVIVILGILAAIVVFAVTGITGKGSQAACATDAKTIEAAEESFLAQTPASTTPNYATMAQLVSGGFLHATSQDWVVSETNGNTATTPTVPSTYTLASAGAPTAVCAGMTPP